MIFIVRKITVKNKKYSSSLNSSKYGVNWKGIEKKFSYESEFVKSFDKSDKKWIQGYLKKTL